jgi:hypothetical protein
MALPSTDPLDGEFWYVLDDENNLVWKPRPELRGDFYLGWLGQNKNIVGAGLARVEQGQLTQVCLHGTPYYWLQPYERLPLAVATFHDQQMLGADTVALDFSLAGWGMRNQIPPEPGQWSDTAISADALQSHLASAAEIIVRNFRSETEPEPKSEYKGLLARAMDAQPRDPFDELLALLQNALGPSNVVPVLIELIKTDVNVLPSYRQSSVFETLKGGGGLPSPNKIARLVLSAIYHLAPQLGSSRLNNALLLNSLRQRHPFDVTWGADFVVKCFGMPNLVRVLLNALVQEQDDQVRGNVLDLLQELGYGLSIGLEEEVLERLAHVRSSEYADAFGQVVETHLAFTRTYISQRDAASV